MSFPELNLPSYKDSETFDLIDPGTQEPLGVKLELARAGSAIHAAAKHKAVNKVHEALRKGGKNMSQVNEAADLDVLVACTLGWSFSEAVLAGSKPPELTPENARAFYKRHGVVKQAAEDLIRDQEAFRC